MLISVDGYEASADYRVGVGRFEVELLKYIKKYDYKNAYRVYVPRKTKQDLPHEDKKWKYRVCSFNRLWSQLALPFYLLIDKPNADIFFSPVHYAPRFIRIPLVLGIMDLSFLFFPDMFYKKDLYKLKHWTFYSLKKASHIIAISESTKNDILSKYAIDDKKITVVYPGVFEDNMRKNRITIDDLRIKYRIKNNYILYVGTLQPRKNITRLIEAFSLVINKEYTLKNSLQLVIVGKKGWLYDTIYAKVHELKMEKHVVFTGFVPDDELVVFYRHARCFCLVSLYEGFGFPVLEAMQRGTPVIASNVSSLPEIVGNAGLLVDPENIKEIARGIQKILHLSSKERKKLIMKGKEQAAQFTWKKAALKTIDIFEKVGKGEI